MRNCLVHGYPWTDDDGEVAFDAVTVGIGSDQVELAKLGLPCEEPVASVMWPTVVYGGGESMEAREEGPFTVPEALARAHELALATGLNGVVISLQDRSLWKPEWGTLAPDRGITGQQGTMH